MRPIIIQAPAKINLFLHITGRNENNYSFLESLVAFSEYGDEIQVTEAGKLTLEVSGKFSNELKKIDSEDNLVWKAALELQNFFGKKPGANIKLVKNLPVASGIGGGSSDAAATINALRKLWKIDINDEELSKIAIKLGSDVPVCLYSNTSLMSGIGEKLKAAYLKTKPYIVLVNPNIHLPTADIFNEFWKNPLLVSNSCELNEFSIEEISDEKKYSNSLQPFAVSKLPIIGEIIEILKSDKNCSIVRMSGSGATCFGLYNDKILADNAQRKLQELYPGSWCISTRIK